MSNNIVNDIGLSGFPGQLFIEGWALFPRKMVLATNKGL